MYVAVLSFSNGQDFLSSLYLIAVATSDLGRESFAFIKLHAFFLERE